MVGFFGKRNRPQDLPPQKITTSNWGASAAPMMAPADSDGISRIFPKEVFQGKAGEFLKSVGYSPDAVGNIAWTADTFATLDARYREKLERFVDRANRVLKNGWSVRPFFLIPETVWQGEYRNFLCATCRFYPADASNVFFLADTLKTAEMLKLPMQANISPTEAHDFAVQIIATLGDMYEKAKAETNPKFAPASVAYEGARGLSTVMTVKLFEPPQYEPEHKLFGPPMDRDFDKLL